MSRELYKYQVQHDGECHTHTRPEVRVLGSQILKFLKFLGMIIGFGFDGGFLTNSRGIRGKYLTLIIPQVLHLFSLV